MRPGGIGDSAYRPEQPISSDYLQTDHVYAENRVPRDDDSPTSQTIGHGQNTPAVQATMGFPDSHQVSIPAEELDCQCSFASATSC
jgi:hypothetical protein